MQRVIPALLIACCVFGALSCAAQATQPASETGAGLRIYLMTFSPGSVIYERFGHLTLVVHDPNPSAERVAERQRFDEAFAARHGGYPRGLPPLLPTDRAHHYGAFGFDQPGFVPRFVMGRMEYWTASDWADYTALLYGLDNRSVLLQELNLGPGQKLELRRFLEWNELPENRMYRYDYYRDNCATRVRDAIDVATGGALKRQMAGAPTGTTYRSHTRRLTAGLDPLDLFWFTGFTYMMGHPADVPLSAWDDAFLPGTLAAHLRGVTIPDADGNPQPLVLSEQMLATTTRTAMPVREPRRTGAYAVAGILIGGAFVGLALLARRGKALPPSPGTPGEGGGEGPSFDVRRSHSRGKDERRTSNIEHRTPKRVRTSLVSRLARVGFALLIVPWVLLCGIGGCLAAGAWLFTDHAVAYRNENLMQISPLILPLAVLGPTLAFGRRRGARVAVTIGVAMAGLSVLGLVLKVFPAFWQHNGEIIALALPANVGIAAALVLLARRVGPAANEPGTPGKASGQDSVKKQARDRAAAE